jgi:ribonuclease R
MRDQIGEQFEGVVSAVTSFGAFVEIEEPYVEGLIKLDSLGSEQWVHDAIHMRLTGARTGRTIELGDKVKVEINNVSVIRRRIDFTLIATQTTRVRKPPKLHTPVATERVGLARKKQAGREVERAQRGSVERGAAPRKGAAASSTGGKLRLGVSHRGIAKSDGGSGGGRRKAADGGRRGNTPKKRGR